MKKSTKIVAPVFARDLTLPIHPYHKIFVAWCKMRGTSLDSRRTARKLLRELPHLRNVTIHLRPA